MGELSRCFSTVGKGDAPRNCYSKKFKDNFDKIKWIKKPSKKKKK